jgi:3-oxoacyl-[acyl-carrier protein] reductase
MSQYPIRKSAIVTGSSRGIGRAIALRLARDGFSVLVNYAGNQTEAEKVVAEITSAGGQAIAVKGDVSKVDDVAGLFDAAEAAFGGVDVLVNNAGIMSLAKIEDSSDALFDSQVAINFKGTFNTMREAAKRLHNNGRVVNFSTSVVGLKLETYAVYAASKAAVETLTNIFAKEMRGRAITVNAIAPGPTATDLFLNGKPQEVIERMSKMAPLERLGTPDDIAGAVAFLVGPDGGWINGQVLRANGGVI